MVLSQLENRQSYNWDQFLAVVVDRVPGLSIDDLRHSSSLAEICGGDALRRALLLGVFFDLGSQMPDDMLRSISTLGEAYDWMALRLDADERHEVAPDINETLTIKIRPISPDDVPSLYEAMVHPSFGYRWRYRGTTPSPASVAQDLFDGSSFVQFVVERKVDFSILGMVQAYNARPDSGTCYFAFTRTAREQDPISEMFVGLYLFISYLFRTFPLRKLYAEVPGFNWDRFESGVGEFFEVEGRLKEHDYYGGRYWDQFLIALRRERWEKVESDWSPVLRGFCPGP